MSKIMKTDVPGIMHVRKGVLINMSPKDKEVEKERTRMIEDIMLRERINRIESEVSEIKDALLQILQKVSQ